MRQEDLHPAAIMRQESNARLAEQRASGILKNIAAIERKQLRDHSDLGAELVTIRKARKGDDFLATLKRLGISTSVAYEDISIFENWALVSGAGSKRESLKMIKENLLSTKPEDVENDESSGAYASDEDDEEAEIDVSGETSRSETGAPVGPGDASEGSSEGVIWGADGEPLPPTAKAAIDDDTLDKWLVDSRDLYQRLAKLPESESGAFVSPNELKKRLAGISKSVKAQRPDPKRMYRCPVCKGGGCESCRKKGWMPFTYWSDLK